MTRHRLTISLLAILIVSTIGGCAWFDNQTTYFNTYYNMNRIMDHVKDEFEYVDEGRREKPRVLVPGLDSALSAESLEKGNNTYKFLRAFMIDRAKLQPVAKQVE